MSKRLIIDLTDEEYERYSHWTEAVAFRISDLGDGTGRLEVTDDLDRITRPENES